MVIYIDSQLSGVDALANRFEEFFCTPTVIYGLTFMVIRNKSIKIKISTCLIAKKKYSRTIKLNEFKLKIIRWYIEYGQYWRQVKYRRLTDGTKIKFLYDHIWPKLSIVGFFFLNTFFDYTQRSKASFESLRQCLDYFWKHFLRYPIK